MPKESNIDWQTYTLNAHGLLEEVPRNITQEEALRLVRDILPDWSEKTLDDWLEIVKVQVAAHRSGNIGKTTGIQVSYSLGRNKSDSASGSKDYTVAPHHRGRS